MRVDHRALRRDYGRDVAHVAGARAHLAECEGDAALTRARARERDAAERRAALLDGGRRAAYASAWTELLSVPRPADYTRRDADGALIGWRAWRWAGAPVMEARLRSPYRRTVWPGPVLRAATWPVEGTRVRDAPGIHARWTEGRAGGPFDVFDIIGEVRGYGRFAAGPEGWRAEEVVIVRLRVPASTHPAVVRDLAARYGVPVEVM